MKCAASALVLALMAASPASAGWSETAPAWFGAGVQYAHGQPYYVYLPGYAKVPSYGPSYSFQHEYAYVSGYYPPRYFEPELVRTRLYERARLVTRVYHRRKKVICHCEKR
jgi:hypothetical protein